MTQINNNLKKEVLSHLDIANYYKGEGLKLSRPDSKDQVKALCLFHGDTVPSLSINLKTGRFKCFGCDASGSVFDFYMKQHSVDFKTALKELAEKAGCNIQTSQPAKGKQEIVKTYDYLDKEGNLVFQVCRTEPKDFFQRCPDGNSGWKNTVTHLSSEVRNIPYRLPEVLESNTVFITEGEKDADTLREIGLCGSCNAGGAGKWQSELNDYFKNKRIIILPDNDEKGRKHAQKVAQFLSGVVESIRILNLPGLPEKGDVTDWIQASGTKKELLALSEKQPEWGFEGGYTAKEILSMNFPEPKWAVEGLIPEGLNFLGGKPKTGKSFLALHLCCAVALGGKALGKFDLQKGSALYLCLEDTPRRLQIRLKSILQADPAPDNLHLFPKWPRLNEGGLERLDAFITWKKRNLRLIVIDTFAKFRPLTKGSNINLYETDYEDAGAIKSLADKYGVSILVIHHLRKAPAEDELDTFSGSTGLTGAADGLLILKRTSKRMDAELLVTGRDMEDSALALEFHGPTMTWQYLGNSKDVKETKERQTLFDAMMEIKEPVSPKELAEITGLQTHYIQKTLPILIEEGSAKKLERGIYIGVKADSGNIGNIGNN